MTNCYLPRPPVHQVIIVQLATTAIVSLFAFVYSDVHGYSALLGGLICTLPNMYFVYRAFVYRGARVAEKIVKNFYKAEAVKFILTALLFGLTFKYVKPIQPLTLFLTFFVTQAVHWLTPVLMRKRIKAKGFPV